MNTKIAILDELKNHKSIIKEAADRIKLDGTVAFPTETVYGLGANACSPIAIKKIFVAKGRPQDNPLIIHVASKEIASYVKEVPIQAYQLIDAFWPGPLTLIFKKSHLIPDETSSGLDTVGIRMPSHPVALALIEESGVPIAAPSANVSGRPSPTIVSRVIEDLNGRVDYILGYKHSEVGLESTIVDCSVYPFCVLRPGGISFERLKEIDDTIYLDPHLLKRNDEIVKPKAPGMKYRHYAPKAPVRIVHLSSTDLTIKRINELKDAYLKENKNVGIIATDETMEQYRNASVLSIGSRYNLETVGQNLFEVLRKLDDLGVDIILAEGFDETGIGLAIMNRLKKAASYDVIDQ